jgi:hypothetical protein
MHNLHTDHVTIQSELKFLIGAKVVMLICRVFGGKTGLIAIVQVFVWYDRLQLFGSGSEPDLEPTQEFGTVANTRCCQLDSVAMG